MHLKSDKTGEKELWRWDESGDLSHSGRNIKGFDISIDQQSTSSWHYNCTVTGHVMFYHTVVYIYKERTYCHQLLRYTKLFYEFNNFLVW